MLNINTGTLKGCAQAGWMVSTSEPPGVGLRLQNAEEWRRTDGLVGA